VELAAGCRVCHLRGLTKMAGIPFVFTIARVAELLGEDNCRPSPATAGQG
jgi:hypothetical protein